MQMRDWLALLCDPEIFSASTTLRAGELSWHSTTSAVEWDDGSSLAVALGVGLGLWPGGTFEVGVGTGVTVGVAVGVTVGVAGSVGVGVALTVTLGVGEAVG